MIYEHEENKPTRAFLYVRTSTVDQVNSIGTQETQLKEECMKKGYVVADIFRDQGQSGKNTDRPEFQRMLSMIQNSAECPADLVLCTKLDRFARSLVDLNTQVLVLQDHGVRFSTLQQDFDINSPVGKLLFNILGSFAEFERAIINERTREGYQAAKKRGVICNRPKLDLPKKKILDYILNKKLSASAVAKIYGTTAATIKHRLNEWGYRYENNEWVKQ